MEMSSSIPYLLRALYAWIVDNGCTPYVVIDATLPGTRVPTEYVQDGRIVLNISPAAVRDLRIEEDAVRFGGRFGGIAREIEAPIAAIAAIYARENGQGMWFPREDGAGPDATPPDDTPGGGKPALRVVK